MAPETRKLSLWTAQGLHAGGLAVLLAITAAIHKTLSPLEGNFLGFSSDAWLLASIAAPILHQTYVWVCWRTELLSKAVSRSIGFSGYRAGFFVLAHLRILTLIPLAYANRGSLPLSPSTRAILATLLFLPCAYTAYSVLRYFGFGRATGADHFDEKYRTMPFVKEGIFRWSGNAMYGFAFLGLWSLAIGFASTGALLAAAFSHAYIWLHYFVTEKPDVEFIYGKA